MYANELDENDVQLIFNLDLEFGQFIAKRRQLERFLKRIEPFRENEVA